jgi:hypothetical protein
MKIRFDKILIESLKDLYNKPLASIPFIFLYFFINYFGYASEYVKIYLTTTFLNIAWLGLFFLLTIVVSSLAALLSISILSNNKIKFRTFGHLVLYYLIYQLLIISNNALSNYIAILTNSLPIILFINLIFLFVIFIFIEYAPVFIVIKRNNLLDSIKNSIKLTRETYLYLLCLGLIVFILSWKDLFFGALSSQIISFIETVAIQTYIFAILIRMINSKK